MKFRKIHVDVMYMRANKAPPNRAPHNVIFLVGRCCCEERDRGGARLRRELSNQFCDRYMMEDTGPLYYNFGSNTKLLGIVK